MGDMGGDGLAVRQRHVGEEALITLDQRRRDERSRKAHRYSGLKPALCSGLVLRSTCTRTKFAKSSGVSATGSAPSGTRRFSSASLRPASLNVAFSFVPTSLCMPFGPKKPNHDVNVRLGMPLSTAVGTSGASALRFAR